MNKVILTGRLTRDPESRMSQNNMEVSRFSLACQGEFVSRTGERSVEFINCVAFGNLASTVNRYCRKGQMIAVTGRIRNSSYDAQDGSKRYSTDVVVEQMEFMSSRNSDTQEMNSNPQGTTSAYSPAPSPQSNIETTDISEDPYKDFGDEFTLSSDDLPF
jgi:single-strand DNA-binding protein